MWTVARAATASIPPPGIRGETLRMGSVSVPAPARRADWIASARAD